MDRNGAPRQDPQRSRENRWKFKIRGRYPEVNQPWVLLPENFSAKIENSGVTGYMCISAVLPAARKHVVLALASVVVVSIALGQSSNPNVSKSARAASPSERVGSQRTRRSQLYTQTVWGVDAISTKSVESGAMIRFTYRVLDPQKAKAREVAFASLSGLQKVSGSDLLSHAVSRGVPSALVGLTSVFGMGTGVTPPI